MIHIVIISSNPLARLGLSALLADFPDCEVVHQVSSELELPEDPPDVLLWDLSWENTLPDTAKLPPIVALIADEQDAADLLNSGVDGLLSRESSGEQIYAALLAVSNGLSVFDPAFVPLTSPNNEAKAQPDTPLTPREKEVLQYLAEGLPNKNIAFQMGVSEHTVKFHVNAIFGKLDVQSRTEAVVKGTKLGLIIL
jgi:two-component system, NarL family, nitrate/nitrite response regulator NarL